MTFKDPADRDRAHRDQDLFDRVARRYADKDLKPAMRVAREHRALATWKAMGQESVSELLEVGCGAGFGAAYLRGRYGSYNGIDYSRELIQIAAELNGSERVRFEVADAKTIRLANPPDAVLLIGVLHHIDQPSLALRHLHELLSPGGVLLANEPQDTNPLVQVARRIRARVDPDYSADQEYYNPRSLAALVEEAGFVNVEITGQGLFTTPFAEVSLPGQSVLTPLVRACAAIDRSLEAWGQGLMRRMAWNTVVVGRKPPQATAGRTEGPS